MEENKQKIIINVSNPEKLTDPIEVILREGAAPKAIEELPTKEPLSCNLDGIITTPANWLEKRIKNVELSEAYLVVDRENMQI